MNKKLNLLCLPLLAVMGLAACEHVDIDIDFGKTAVAKIAEKNASAYDGYKQLNTLKTHQKVDFRTDFTATQRFGVVGLLSDDNHFGLYNLIHDEVILDTNVANHTQAHLTYRETGGTVIFRVGTSENYIIFDSLGNKIEGIPFEHFTQIIIKEINGDFYLKDDMYSNVDVFYKLTDEGWKRVSLLPPQNSSSLVDYGYQPVDGQNYRGSSRIDMAKCGYDGYEVYFGPNYMATAYSKNKPVARYKVPENATDGVIVGRNLYYQIGTMVQPMDTEFDVYYDDEKYIFNTYKLDLLNGDVEEIDFDYIIDSSDTLLNKNGVYKIANLKVKVIEDKMVTDVTNILFNENLEVVADVGILDFSLLVKTGNGYYDNYNGILFDKEMMPIGYYDDFDSATYYQGPDVIIAKIDNTWGAIDSTGKVVMDFKYEQIVANQSSPYVSYMADPYDVLYNINTGNEVTMHDFRKERISAIDAGDYDTYLDIVRTNTGFEFKDMNGSLYVGNYPLDDSMPYDEYVVKNAIDERAFVVYTYNKGRTETEKFVFVVDEKGVELSCVNYTI